MKSFPASRRLMWALCVLLTGFMTGAQAQDTLHQVPFLTVRDVGSADGPNQYFGDSRGSLSAGWCLVRDVPTGAFAPVVEAGPSFLREQLLQIDTVRTIPPRDLIDGLQARDPAPIPALYVHGYFIDFEKGCRRAALFQKNADLAGHMIWFSWPSDGDIANYTRDESDLYWSVPDIASAILDLHDRAQPGQPVDVIGHSLGGRGVVLALLEIAYRRPDIRLGKVVLLAPDMDFEIFARMLPRLSPLVDGFTVYATDEDRPLQLSEQVHGYRRLGQTGNDVAALDGIDLIDISALPNQTASGHLYHIHNAQVGQDLTALLNARLPVTERANLVQIGRNTWALQP